MAEYIKSDMIRSVAQAADITREKAEKAVNSLLATMTAHLNDGHTVRLAGFGSFIPVRRAPRRLKLHGVERITRAVDTVKFRPYEGLKKRHDD